MRRAKVHPGQLVSVDGRRAYAIERIGRGWAVQFSGSPELHTVPRESVVATGRKPRRRPERVDDGPVLLRLLAGALRLLGWTAALLAFAWLCTAGADGFLAGLSG